MAMNALCNSVQFNYSDYHALLVKDTNSRRGVYPLDCHFYLQMSPSWKQSVPCQMQHRCQCSTLFRSISLRKQGGMSSSDIYDDESTIL